MQKQAPSFWCIRETHFNIKDRQHLRVQRRKKIFLLNGHTKKQANVAILMYCKTDFKPRQIRRDKEGHYILIQGKVHERTLQFFFQRYHILFHLCVNAQVKTIHSQDGKWVVYKHGEQEASRRNF